MKKISVLILIAFGAFACTPNNVKINDAIGKQIDSAGMKGSFALMENSTEAFTIYNLSAYKDSGYAPLNTFFALPILIGFDKGQLNADSNTWVSLDSSAYYQQLVKQIGRNEILQEIDSIHYGKGIVSANMDSFWRDESLLITADEQLGFMKQLYFKGLPFQKRSQELFSKMILKEANSNYKLSYLVATDNALGNQAWVVGYIEENLHPYFFVLHTSATDGNDLKNRNINLLKSILMKEGFFKGVR
jgi:beta-lactamase class D